MRKIELRGIRGKDKFALIDNEDYEYLSQFKWYFSGRYIYRVEYKHEYENRKRKIIKMHRLINQTPKNFDTDHRDNNTFNNQKNNLRTCTRKQNAQNQKLSKNNISGYKGVYWAKANKKWAGRIYINGKRIFLGVFDFPEFAAIAYNLAAKKYFGEFARLNEI